MGWSAFISKNLLGTHAVRDRPADERAQQPRHLRNRAGLGTGPRSYLAHSRFVSHTVGLRRAVTVLAIASAGIFFGGSLGGCMAFAPIVDEPTRFATVTDFSPEALGFRSGETTFEEAKAALSKRGLTGIVEDVYAEEPRGLVAALGADYQSRIHIFRAGRFVESVTLPLRGLPPYGMALRLGRESVLASEDASEMLLVLYRDPANRAEVSPTLLAFRGPQSGHAGSFELVSAKPLGDLVAQNDGMTSPMLLGGTMSDGMFLVARDRDGVLWDTSYVVRASSNEVTLEPRPMMEAIRCSCVRKYALGAMNR